MRLQHENGPHTAPAGLYIHIPFCVRKCPYCDFYSITDLHKMEAFVDALIEEMSLVTLHKVVFDTIYVGGGTPSLLTPGQLNRVLQNALEGFTFEDNIEASIEVNPGTISVDSITAFLNCGINRVTIGIQSFDDDKLRFLGRIHSSEVGREAIRRARQAGVQNLGLDLIYGLPNQSLQDWRSDLKEAVGYEPEHLSCYMLSYEKGTPLDHWRRAGRFRPLEEAAVSDLFEVTVDFLSRLGYEQYEISNFSRGNAFRSRHNQKYWRHSPYIGLGPSAHSFVEPKRWWNERSVDGYLRALQCKKSAVLDSERLTERQLMLESVLLGLRTSGGISPARFKSRYGIDLLEEFGELLARLQAEGMVSLSCGQCRLTGRGILLADTIIGMFADQMKE